MYRKPNRANVNHGAPYFHSILPPLQTVLNMLTKHATDGDRAAVVFLKSCLQMMIFLYRASLSDLYSSSLSRMSTGIKEPDTSQTMDAIYAMEDEAELQAKAAMYESHSSYPTSGGLHSDGPEEEELGSNISNMSAPGWSWI